MCCQPGNLLQHQQSDLVAAIEKMAGLRIVRRANDVAVQNLAEDLRILALRASGHGASGKREGLVAIESAQLHDLSVQGETVIGKSRLAEANPANLFI